MTRRAAALKRTALLAFAVAATLPAVFVPATTYSSRTLNRLHDFAHVPLFAVVTLLLCAAWPGGLFADGRLKRFPAVRVLLTAVLAGILVELFQARQGRFPEPADVLADAAGAAVGMTLLVGFKLRRRRPALLLALVLTLPFALPTLISAWDEQLARRSFPLIADFESRWQTDRFKASLSRLQRVSDPSRPGNHMMSVAFQAETYPRFSLRDLPRDWSPHHRLSFTCHNPGDRPFDLIVRVDDIHHDNRPDDRFRLRLRLPPGRHPVEIPLKAVAGAPRGRTMDMAAINQLTFYGHRLTEARTLLFDDFRLE